MPILCGVADLADDIMSSTEPLYWELNELPSSDILACGTND